MKRIMIVDNHDAMRRMICSIIENAVSDTVELVECDSGEEAIKAYKEHQPDYVLMDLHLKHMNGFQAIEQIYEIDADANILIVTSLDTPTYRNRAEELNTKAFVCKDNMADLTKFFQDM